MNDLFYVALGGAAGGLIVFVALNAKKAFAWLKTKLSNWWSGTEKRFQAIETDVSVLKKKVGV